MEFEGIFLTADQPTANGSIYPKETIQKALEEYQKTIDKCRAFGELNSSSANILVDGSTSSHVVEEIKQDGDSFIAKVRILETESGKQLQNLINAEVPMKLVSKGIG